MSSSLDDLLSSCSQASRALRFLTAEAKRRAVLLRACCSEYELALERLSHARLHPLNEGDREGEGEKVHARRPRSPEKSARQGENGQSRLGSLHAAKLESSSATSATPARPTNFGEPFAESAAAIGTAVAGDFLPGTPAPSSPRRELPVVSKFFDDSGDSSRITKSLEEILEQARSIRTSSISLKKTAIAAPSRQRTAGVGGSISSGPSKAAGSRRGRGQTPRSTHSTHSFRGGVRGVKGAGDATQRAPTKSRVDATKTPAGSDLNALQGHSHHRLRTGPANPGTRQPDLGEVLKQGRATSVRRTQKGHSQSNAQRLQRSERTLVDERRGVGLVAPEPASGAAAVDVATNLESGIWEEVASYEAARASLMATSEGSSSSGSGSGSGCGGAGSGSRGDFEAAEEALLRGLDDACSALPSNGGGYHKTGERPQPDPALADPALADPAFLDWRERLLSPSRLQGALEGMPCRRDANRQRRLGGGIVDQTKGGKYCRLGRRGVEEEGDLGILQEVGLLQQSLLMLLDEMEGRRAVIAHEDLQRKRTAAERWTDEEGARRGQGGRGEEEQARSLQEFEDWYCWNMATHVTGLLRERLDEVARDGAGGNGGRPPLLSKEAARLIENPYLVLSGENPLRVLSRLDDDSTRRNLWHWSSGAKDLRGTECFALVDELQGISPSCCLKESGSGRKHATEHAAEHAAELCGGQFRTTCMIAAEADISRLVVPALARALSHGCCRKGQSDPSPDDLYQHVQEAVAGAPAGTLGTSRGDLGDVGYVGFRDKRQTRPVSTGQGTSSGLSVADNQENSRWAPALAVFRAVDAVLTNGGRPRVSFVRRSAACS